MEQTEYTSQETDISLAIEKMLPKQIDTEAKIKEMLGEE